MLSKLLDIAWDISSRITFKLVEWSDALDRKEFEKSVQHDLEVLDREHYSFVDADEVDEDGDLW